MTRFASWSALCVVMMLGTSAPTDAQDATTVFTALEGRWAGTGTVMGRPGAFEMLWEVQGNGFVRLSFSNGWIEDDGATSPLMSAEATYRVQGGTAIGVWVDSRPQQLRLHATLTDSTVTTEWVADTERGRTEYRVRSADEVVVQDWVESDGEMRVFGEATYRRAGG